MLQMAPDLFPRSEIKHGAPGATSTVLEPGTRILGTSGRLHLAGVRWRDASGRRQSAACDLMCVSAGWMPTAHLAAQLGARLSFDPATQSLMPAAGPDILRPVGGARGVRYKYR